MSTAYTARDDARQARASSLLRLAATLTVLVSSSAISAAAADPAFVPTTAATAHLHRAHHVAQPAPAIFEVESTSNETDAEDDLPGHELAAIPSSNTASSSAPSAASLTGDGGDTGRVSISTGLARGPPA
jgi:hypothetical protein